MPIDKAELTVALTAVDKAYKSGPTAVRTGRVISPLHAYCAYELRRTSFKGKQLPSQFIHPPPPPSKAAAQQLILKAAKTKAPPKRLNIVGAYMPKEIDVALVPPYSGPLLAVSVKSQMTSIAKNATNRFEEYIGDATNLHSRFPMLVFGFVMMLPVGNETIKAGKPTDTLTKIAALLERANGREKSDEPPGGYDASALILVDYSASPPKLHPDFPDPKTQSGLRIENFFDRLIQLYFSRNQFV
jgi:hypothetical protein